MLLVRTSLAKRLVLVMNNADPGRMVINIVGGRAEHQPDIGRILETSGLQVSRFHTEPEFLDSGTASNPGCVLTRVRSEPTTLPRELQTRWLAMPVIVVADTLTPDQVVAAMKSGAVDVLTGQCERLVSAIQEALDLDGYRREWVEMQRKTAEKVDRLSPRQREVLEQIAIGKPNKVVAKDLYLSPRTVEKHRREVLHRIGASNVAEAAALWERYQLPASVAFSLPARSDIPDRRAG